jgi:hypothetical protein
MAWLAVPVITLILVKKRVSWFPVSMVLAVSLLTNLIYPVLYMDLMALGDTSVTILTLRNVLLVVLLAWANIKLGDLSKESKS